MRCRNVSSIWAGECLALCLFVGIVLTCGAADEKSVAPPLPDHDPFVGVWKVNPDKSHPKLTAKDVQCQVGTDRKDGPCTVAVSRIGNGLVSKVIAIGMVPWESLNSESAVLCDGERHLLEKAAPAQPGPVFRAGDSREAQNESPAMGSGPPPRSYSLCVYISPSSMEGELGIDLHDPHDTGQGNSYFFGTITYWRDEVSPDGQQRTYTEFSDKKRTKVKRAIVSDRIK